MFGWIKKVFGKRRIPKKGELWVLKSSVRDESPFPIKKDRVLMVDILDVKNNWVRYAYVSRMDDLNMPDSDERKPIDYFLRGYEPVVPLWENEEVIRRILNVRQS